MKTTLVLIMTAALLAAGCGGSSEGDDGGAGNSGGGGGASSNGAVEYAQCMRENGVPEFPDPVDGRLQLRAGPGGIDPNSEQFRAAQEACQSLAPQGPAPGSAQRDQMEDQILEYARCMRENGLPDFPDPDLSGAGFRMQLPPGVSQDSPQFQKAQQACAPLLAELGGAP